MQFSYESYSAQQANRKPSGQGGNLPKTRFINEWLKNDGDVVVCRFPYHSMSDISFDSVHKVTFPGDRYGKWVRCEGDNCPLCRQGVKVDFRFFLKAIVYVVDSDTGTVSLVPAIWDRPAAFADIELKGLMDDYGDLSQCLFKIKRNGTGLETRYTINIITNKAIYNPDVYKADFSVLEFVDPVKVFTKPVQMYIEACNNGGEETTEQTTEVEEVKPSAPVEQPKPEPKPQVVVEQPKPEQPQTPTESPVAKPKRYTF